MSAWRLASPLLALLVLALGLAAAAPAQQPAPNPKLQKAYAKLQQQYGKLQAAAARQDGHKQAESRAKLAELDLKFAEAGYAVHRPDEAERHLASATQLADQAMAALKLEAARGKTDGMKKVEISFQSIAYALRSMAQQLPFRQRAPVEATDHHFSTLRAQLLQLMFAPKKKH